MDKIKILGLLIFFAVKCFATNSDSILINDLKKFIINETDFKLHSSFYTAWSKSEKPFVNLYISSKERISSPYNSTFTPYGTDEERAKVRAEKEEKLGNHAFIYKTYATSIAELNNRFFSYSRESKCFIILHEFFHHYRRELSLAIPYEFEEAIGDIVGNYGAIEFMFSFKNSKHAKRQKSRNERIYKIVNKTTDKINSSPKNVEGLNLRCQKRIQNILAKGDSFQKDRFNYRVNNAYLLKNRFYSEKYFLLKRVFLKTETVTDFLNVIKNCPSGPRDFEVYLNSFLKT